MQVAFFADLLYYRIAGGTTRYAAELVRHLESREDVELRLFSLYPREVVRRLAAERGYPGAESLPSRLPRRLRYLLWNTLGRYAPDGGILTSAEVVHTPALLIPPSGRRALVVTLMDLAFVLFPQYFGRWWRTLAMQGLRRTVRDAAAIIAISRHTADDLMRLCGVPSKRIHVVPLAADEHFLPVDDPGVLMRYEIDAPYILCVGTLEPRKNVPALLQAFMGIEQRETKLVLTGAQGWMHSGIYDMIDRLGLRSRVSVAGFVPDEDLPALLSGATTFVYPSLYEGFGLPVLEAMSCGTPVITTNVSSLPEVAGDAAILVAPGDVEALRRAIQRVLDAPDLREELRGRGLAQAARFSWRRTAEETVGVYEQVVSGTR